MGPTRLTRKEFWWEREWRHVGDFHFFVPSRIVGFLVPEADHARFAVDMIAANEIWRRKPRPLLDPSWGLERMIVSLADLDPEHVGPFPAV